MRTIVVVLVLSASMPAYGQYEWSVSSGDANVGEFYSADVTLTNDGFDVEGYEFRVCNTNEVVVDAVNFDKCFLDDTCIVTDPGVSFVVHTTTLDDEGFTVAAVLETDTNVIPVGSFPIYVGVYEVLEEGEAELTFCDTANVTVDSEAIDTDNFDGSIDIGPSQFTLSLSSVDAESGSTASVVVSLDSEGDPLVGWAFGVCGGGILSIDEEDIMTGEALEDLEFFFNGIDAVDGGWTVGVALNTILDSTLESGEDLELYQADYEVTGDTGEFEDLEICTLVDSDPADGLIVYERYALITEATRVIPTIEFGTVTVVDPAAGFLRGDADGDGEVTPILDALALLVWGFVDGDTPPCMDAADVDDSGEVFPIVDALAVLEWGFGDGDTPPDPGPNECGEDPTDDDVACLEEPACP